MARKKKLFQKTASKLITFTDPHSYVAEQFRTLRTNITFSLPDANMRTIVVTSAAPLEGKSMTSANLAVIFAQEGKKVLMVDGDMRKPTSHYTFNMENTAGLSSVLMNQTTAENAIRSTMVERLDVLTSGPIPSNPAELLSSKSMDALLDQLTEMYEMVIFDAPPMLSIADGQILANKCDGAILVIDSGQTQKDMALKAKEAIESSNTRILGAVLNNFMHSKYNSYYQYYNYTH